MLDGLAIQVKCPVLKFVSDPGNFYCGKAFYGLNVQEIFNKFKRFLWCAAPVVKGSCHDSTAFQDTKRFQLLVLGSAQEFFEKGLFLVGESAYLYFLSF